MYAELRFVAPRSEHVASVASSMSNGTAGESPPGRLDSAPASVRGGRPDTEGLAGSAVDSRLPGVIVNWLAERLSRGYHQRVRRQVAGNTFAGAQREQRVWIFGGHQARRQNLALKSAKHPGSIRHPRPLRLADERKAPLPAGQRPPLNLR